MIKPQAFCDRCESVINGCGYSVTGTIGQRRATIEISAEINQNSPDVRHLCGKECLIKDLSHTIDRVFAGKEEKHGDVS
ncbi:MAG TPA: hypothetical protein PK587_04220 [Syntrophales bacterium]|nr:hypothetical protein [Syntrophales bacterium]